MEHKCPECDEVLDVPELEDAAQVGEDSLLSFCPVCGAALRLSTMDGECVKVEVDDDYDNDIPPDADPEDDDEDDDGFYDDDDEDEDEDEEE